MKSTFTTTLKLATPIASIRLILMLNQFIGMVMIAKLGTEALAAGALIYSIRITLSLFFMAILFSTAAIAGRLYGEKRLKDIGELMRQGMLLAILLSIPLNIIFYNIGTILTWFHQPAALIHYVNEFFRYFIIAIPAILMMVVGQQIMFAFQKSHWVILTNFISLAIVIILGYGTIFGHFGLPKMGVAGLGLTYAISAWTGLAMYFLVYCLDKDFQKLHIFRCHIDSSLQYLKKIAQVGWPIGVQIGGELLSTVVMAIIIGWLGIQMLAAQQVIMQYLFLFVVPIFGVSEAASIQVGQAFGERSPSAIRQCGFNALLIGIIAAGIIAIVYIAFPIPLASLYASHGHKLPPATLAILPSLFAFTAGIQFFDGIRNVLTGALRGLYDTHYPMWVGLIVIWLFELPLGLLLAFPLGFGIEGLYFASCLGMIIASGLIILRWRKKLRITMLKDQNAPQTA